MSDTPIEQVSGWSEQHIARIKESWITTAEQIVAVAATSEGIKSLSEQLKISEQETRVLVEAARKTLSPAMRAEMDTAVDTREYGLGVLPPEED